MPRRRNPIHLLLSIGATLAFGSSIVIVASAEERPYFETQLGLLVEYFEVDQNTLAPLLREHQNASDATDLLSKIQSMQEAGKARLTTSSYTLTTPRQSTTIESHREYPYPSAFDSAQVPGDLTGPIDTEADIIAPIRPSDYSTRWIGDSLKFTVSPAKKEFTFAVDYSAGLTELSGFTNWGQGVSKIQLPQFLVRRSANSIPLAPGRSTLLGTFIPSSGSPDKRLLAFATLTEMAAASSSDYADFLKNPPTQEEIAARHDQPTDDPFGGEVDDAPEEWQQVNLIAEYIEVDADLAGQLARQLNTVSDGTKIRDNLDQLIAAGTAKLLDTSSGIASAGVRAVYESIRELTYPTIFHLPGDELLPAPRPPRLVPSRITGPVSGNVVLSTSYHCDQFDSASVGIDLEFEPNISNYGMIHVNFQLTNRQLVSPLGHIEGEVDVPQPVFETLNASGNVIIPDGTSLLLAMHSLETARAGAIATEAERAAMRDRRILVFLTARIKTLK